MTCLMKLKKIRGLASGVKKKVIVQKFSQLVYTNAFVLFFHYNGSKECNWEKVKKKFWQQKIECKGLFLPSNLNSLVGEWQEINGLAPVHHCSRFLAKGPTIVIGCSSVQQMFAVVETCIPPTFLSIGGLYNRGGINHLDIKRWVSLSLRNDNYNNLIYSLAHQGVFISLLQSRWSVLRPIFLQTLWMLLWVFYLSKKFTTFQHYEIVLSQ